MKEIHSAMCTQERVTLEAVMVWDGICTEARTELHTPDIHTIIALTYIEDIL